MSEVTADTPPRRRWNPQRAWSDDARTLDHYRGRRDREAVMPLGNGGFMRQAVREDEADD